MIRERVSRACACETEHQLLTRLFFVVVTATALDSSTDPASASLVQHQRQQREFVDGADKRMRGGGEDDKRELVTRGNVLYVDLHV